MNKNDIVEYISNENTHDLTKVAITEVVELLLKGAKASMKKGEEVKLVGFGTFKVVHKKATTGRNPRTGEAIQIAAKNKVKFVEGKELKETVNS